MQRLTFLALAYTATEAARLGSGRGGRGGRGADAGVPFDGLDLGETTIADAFTTADEDGDGNLTCAEIQSVWIDFNENAVLEEARTSKGIKKIAKRFNTDDVQGLSLAEFTALVDFEYVAPVEDDEGEDTEGEDAEDEDVDEAEFDGEDDGSVEIIVEITEETEELLDGGD